MHLCEHRRFRLIHSGFFVLAWILFLNPMYAQDNPLKNNKESDSLKKHQLNEVIVTTSKREFKVESPMPVQILSGKQLEKIK